MKKENSKFILNDGGKSLENLVKLGENAVSGRGKSRGAGEIIGRIIKKKSGK